MVRFLVFFLLLFTLTSHVSAQIKVGITANHADFKYLALGDSYTIGESVPFDQNFPSQLKSQLEEANNIEIELNIIATTGWTTSDLKRAITEKYISDQQDLVTLLIGVNNQYQGKPFGLYESEFVELLEMAIHFAGGNAENVLVVSIPDYAYTPFGQKKSDPDLISKELDQYNDFAQQQSEIRNVEFVQITDITRNGLRDHSLVAEDDLHPSSRCYGFMVKRIIKRIKLQP